jgi:hypothetical protein
MSWSHVPTKRPWLRVNQISVPTFLGRALCQILAITYGVVEFWRLSLWIKVRMFGVCAALLAFL